MSSTYTEHANVCAKFYQLAIDSAHVAKFICENSRATAGQTALFIGGMFDIAAELKARGLELTLSDYTDEMVELARLRFPTERVEKADLRSLPFRNEFDLVLVVGRVFTHMTSDADLSAALTSCRKSLR